MNERIKRLWNKAALLEPDPSWEGQERFIEKFAGLVVKECADYITEYYPHSRYEAFYMKKHFGVEE
jgi:hypothetical protein